MKKKYLLLLFIIHYFTNAQQDSKVTIEHGNRNHINIIQNDQDTSQKSNVNLKYSDSNYLNVTQDPRNTTETKSEQSWYLGLITNSYFIFGALASIIIIIGGIIKMSKRQRK